MSVITQYQVPVVNHQDLALRLKKEDAQVWIKGQTEGQFSSSDETSRP